MDNKYLISPVAATTDALKRLLVNVQWTAGGEHLASLLRTLPATAGDAHAIDQTGLWLWRRPMDALSFLHWLPVAGAGKKGFRQLSVRGLPGPEILARGMERVVGHKPQQVLVVRGWLPGKYLDDFFAEDFPSLPATHRQAIVRDFGHFVRDMFERGAQPTRLTLTRFWVDAGQDPVGFRLAGIDGFRWHNKPLTDRQRFVCLQHLLGTLPVHVSRSQRFRFFRAVCGDQGRLREFRNLLVDLEAAALCSARRYWRRKARLSLGNNAWFAVLRHENWRIWRRRCDEALRLQQSMLAEPAATFRAGLAMAGRGSGCSAARIEVGGHQYFVKRYRLPGLRYQVKYLFLRSKALAAWLAGWQCAARSLPTAQPLMVMEKRTFRILKESYLVSEFCSDGRPLMTVWPELKPHERRRIIIRSAQLLARVHRSRCLHGDTNWNNILVRPNGALLLVDLDCFRQRRSFDYTRAYRDLEHFIRDLRRKRNDGVGYLDLLISTWRNWLDAGSRVSCEEHARIVRANPGRRVDDCI
ncbi:hypothetical protein A7E75_11125 [Syntrophotalea acetylenica]|jgi:hypothetical protein|uniref:Lipopolysaccharide kinase (Kdo/WaaP) family protein n=1 Tax=Syntrophotalea acetylenica TaxID=29542 RepID=A0A1L3GHV6_SYNAC|nr:hypothetical protein A7E75_11125 [Syntrophotalea acetylenica]APG43576.1 hypothetical protein A6070_05135 [Syntrophotalea acetylenica]